MNSALNTAYNSALTNPVPLTCPIPPIPTSADLASYGIELVEDGKTWSANEKANILSGVIRIGDAFTRFNVLGTTPQDRFKTVMGANARFLRLASIQPSGSQWAAFYVTPDGQCQAFNATPMTVACRGSIANTQDWNPTQEVLEEAVIHELGHIADYRSGNLLKQYIGGGGYVILACDSDIVMGNMDTGWKRGLTGWGSVAYDSGGKPLISTYQQHPSGDPLDRDLEATADMFLNWVYRRTTDNAPAIPNGYTFNFNAPLTEACSYAQQGTWLGFQNIDKDGQQKPNKSGNARYLWMEEVLIDVFTVKLWL